MKYCQLSALGVEDPDVQEQLRGEGLVVVECVHASALPADRGHPAVAGDRAVWTAGGEQIISGHRVSRLPEYFSTISRHSTFALLEGWLVFRRYPKRGHPTSLGAYNITRFGVSVVDDAAFRPLWPQIRGDTVSVYRQGDIEVRPAEDPEPRQVHVL
jgi:hypothetical protein